MGCYITLTICSVTKATFIYSGDYNSNGMIGQKHLIKQLTFNLSSQAVSQIDRNCSLCWVYIQLITIKMQYLYRTRPIIRTDIKTCVICTGVVGLEFIMYVA